MNNKSNSQDVLMVVVVVVGFLFRAPRRAGRALLALLLS